MGRQGYDRIEWLVPSYLTVVTTTCDAILLCEAMCSAWWQHSWNDRSCYQTPHRQEHITGSTRGFIKGGLDANNARMLPDELNGVGSCNRSLLNLVFSEVSCHLR